MNDLTNVEEYKAVAAELVNIGVEYSLSLLSAIVILIAGYVLAGWVSRAIRSRLQTIKRFDKTLTPVLSQIARYAILVFTFVLVLAEFGIQTASIIAVLGAAGLAAFVGALAAAVLLTAALNMLMNITMFWTLAGRGISAMVGGLLFVLSGMAVPLPLMPAWLQPVLNVLPFRGLMDIPFRLFTGSLPPSAMPGLLAHQLGWAAAMILTGRHLMHRAMRRLVVQGG